MYGFLLFSSLVFAVEPVAESQWVAAGKVDGVSLFEKSVKQSDFLAFRGEGLVEAPVWKLASIVLDAVRFTEWIDDVEDAHIVSRLDPLQFISYSHIGTPFVVKDRDFVNRVRLEWEPSFQLFKMFFEPDKSFTVSKTDYVRGEVQGSFQLKAHAKGTWVVAELHANPKGTVPSWIVNVFQKSWAENTFKGLRTQVRKADVLPPKEFKDLFRELKFP